MPARPLQLLGVALLGFVAQSPGQQPGELVVPNTTAAVDGSHRFFIAGVAEPRRQLTLIGAGLLVPLQNRAITGVSFRRNADNETFAGGDANLTIRLSHAATDPASALDMFAANHGTDLAVVFQGNVQLPTSPAPGTTSSIPWTQQNIVHITFQQPFLYSGGTLAIEVTGSPGTTEAAWWPADAVWQPNGGAVASVGAGSGGFGGNTGQWAVLDASNLGPAGTATFEAFGPPGDLAFLGIAADTQLQRIDLGVFGIAGTWAHILDPFMIEVSAFGPLVSPQHPSTGGLALLAARVPTDATILGRTFGSQWFRITPAGAIASSNAHRFTIAATPPSLDMTLVTAPILGADPIVGKIVPACGHVFRFDYQ